MKYQINLFPHQKQALVDAIIHFSLNYLRYILVFTQFVTLCVFFYRFKVDQEIIDLRESIHQKQVIVDATQGLINQVNEIDTKIRMVQGLIISQETQQQQILYLTSKTPITLSVQNFLINSEGVSIEGVAGTSSDIQTFYYTLTNEGRYKQIELTDVSKEGDVYTFTLVLQEFQAS